MKRFTLALLLGLFSANCFAHSDSCAHKFRVQARYLYLFGYLDVGIRFERDAEVLKAAHILRSSDAYSVSKTFRANNLIVAYHNALRNKYPETKLGFDEVIGALEDVYTNGVLSGYCKQMIYSWSHLSDELFFKGNLQKYKAFKADFVKKVQDGMAARSMRSKEDPRTQDLSKISEGSYPSDLSDLDLVEYL